MSDKVKIYEIAREIGIRSKELVEICQNSGFEDITHHSNAVIPERAEDIRKTALKKYKPEGEGLKSRAARTKKRRRTRAKKSESEKKAKAEEQEKQKDKEQEAAKREAEKKEEEARKRKEKQTPSAADVKPVAPPSPKAKQKKEEKDKKKQEKEAKGDDGVKKRTIVFKEPEKQKEQPPTPKEEKEKEIQVTPPITLRQLSEKLGVSANNLLKTLMFEHGIRANINQSLDRELIELLALEQDVEVNFQEPKSAEERLLDSLPEDQPEDLEPRPPVLALLGHVDHGKTTILDCIRESDVAGSEAGGITQDVGAWQISVNDQMLTFVDTPGHEAFTAMRARGAQVTDLVILVVAADDGVMPQTEEALDHARAADVPVVVAINKIDKPNADPEAVKRQLGNLGLTPEEWGGDVGFVEVSGLEDENIDELLERAALEAELLELEANPNRLAQGVVLEARMEEGLGPVANVLIQNGSLRKGNSVVCGTAFGRVRSLTDQSGNTPDKASPSQPVAISGLSEVPQAGEKLLAVDDLDIAKETAEERTEEMRQQRAQPREHVTLENLYDKLSEGETKQLNTVLKGDVQGSLEPLAESLDGLSTNEVAVNILHEGVGEVGESDVLLADASDAVVIAFRVGVNQEAARLAEKRGVQVRDYQVIYEVIQDVRDALEGLLEPEKQEEKLGLAEVRQTFDISSLGTIAGCYVRDGNIRRGAMARVKRNGEQIWEGEISSLKRGEDDVRKVEHGYECGINLKGFNDVQEGDAIECYHIKEIKRSLS